MMAIDKLSGDGLILLDIVELNLRYYCVAREVAQRSDPQHAAVVTGLPQDTILALLQAPVNRVMDIVRQPSYCIFQSRLSRQENNRLRDQLMHDHGDSPPCGDTELVNLAHILGATIKAER